MTRIKIHDNYFVPYISEEEISGGVKRVANQINSHYGSEGEVLLVSVLSGAYMFTSDLAKELELDAEVAFIKVSSYCGTASSTIKVVIDVTQDVKGRDVIITDELVDNGQTVRFLREYFLDRGASSVAVATLIIKPNSMRKDTIVDFHGIEMQDDNFIVGYGLDYNEKGRTLRDIYILEEQTFSK